MVKNILILGATGYAGSSILAAFMDHTKSSSYTVTALVRNAEKAQKLKAFGVRTVVGSQTDVPLLEKLASEADYFINAADADSMEVAQAALKGLKKRYQTTGSKSHFLHISGTGVVADKAVGTFSDNIWYDDNLEQLDTIDPEALHRNVELLLIDADKSGYVNSYIVSPPTIWGQPTHAFAKAGISHTQSIQIPALIKVSLARGAGSYVGEGRNVWDNCHVDEVGAFYVKLYDHIEAGKATHGREGVYFVRADEHSLYDIGKAIGKALYDAGKVTSPEPKPFTQEELDNFFGAFQRYFACNARARGPRGLSTGWRPVRTTKDLLENIRVEVQLTLAGMEEPKPAAKAAAAPAPAATPAPAPPVRRRSLLKWGRGLFSRKH
ncbi:hypothetical protein APHAL10511_003132 [Amanita phalloides]|nr:hypothetical protein APHAL10511_003132 [Amanita phalloides]